MKRTRSAGSIPAPPSDLRSTGVRPTDGDYQRPPPMRPRQPPTPAAMPEVKFRSPVPVSGPYADFLAQQQANRDVVTNARDLRTDARRRIDNVWSGMTDATKKEFGRSPSVEVWDQPHQGAVVALNAARDAEAALLRLEHAGAPASSIAAAFDDFCSAGARWLNAVTARWSPRKVYERQQSKVAEEQNR